MAGLKMEQQTKTTLRQRIINVQSEMDVGAKKQGNNTVGKGYKYATETDLYNALKPLLKRENVGYRITEYGKTDLYKLDNGMWFYGREASLILFSENIANYETQDEEIVIGTYMTAINTDPAKAHGSALTYCYRYGLMKAFGIATDELDPDTSEVTNSINHQSSPELQKESDLARLKRYMNSDPDFKEEVMIYGKNKNYKGLGEFMASELKNFITDYEDRK